MTMNFFGALPPTRETWQQMIDGQAEIDALKYEHLREFIDSDYRQDKIGIAYYCSISRVPFFVYNYLMDKINGVENAPTAADSYFRLGTVSS